MRRCRDAYVVVTPPPGLEQNPALKGRAKVIRSLRDRHVFREGMHFKKGVTIGTPAAEPPDEAKLFMYQ